MTFLAPLFLLGALAISLPILFHLIRRTPTVERRFSSLMFLSPSPPQLSRRSRLDKLLLLLLRCLIIGLIALAFARPFFRDKVPPPAGDAVPRISFILVDASASMKRRDLWADAQARLSNLARQAKPADQVQAVLFERGVRKLMGFEEWAALGFQERAVELERRVKDAGPTWFGGDLGAALSFAAEELNVLGQTHPNAMRQIIVISDLPEGSRVQNLQGFDWPKGIQVVFERLDPKHRNNAGLHPAAEGESTASTGADARPLVRISNSSESKRTEFRLSWVDASGAAAGNPIEFQIAAAKARVVRAPQRPQGASHLVLTGDDEGFDNTLFIAPPVSEQVQVGFIGPGTPDDPAELLFYLQRAFQETRRRTVRLTSLPATTTAVPSEVRFIIAAGEPSEQVVSLLRRHLEAGGHALVVLKDTASSATVERLVNAKGPAASEASVRQYAMLEHVDFNHPVFAPFADPRFSDFTKIHFWKYRHLDTNLLPAARVLARFDGGAPALLEFGVGSGRLLVLASGWHPSDSQLALSSKFVPLLYSILEYAGRFKEHVSLVVAGQELPVRSPDMALRGPDGASIKPVAGKWTLDRPGIFTVVSKEKTYNVVVNLDPVESQTAPLDTSDLEKLGVPLRAEGTRTAALIEKERKWAQATEVESRQKFWRWLIVGALLLVLAEIWLAARMSRVVAAV